MQKVAKNVDSSLENLPKVVSERIKIVFNLFLSAPNVV